MGLVGDLAKAELATRKGTFLALALALGLAVATAGVTTGLVAGVADALASEVKATVTGDIRVTRGPTDLGGGRRGDELAFAARDLVGPEGKVGVRLELEGLVGNGTAGPGLGALLIGIAPDDPLDLRSRVTRGVVPATDRVWVDGRTFVPILVGRPLLDALHGEVHPGEGPIDPSMRVNLTAGHLTVSGGRVVPVSLPGIIVGTYETGFRAVDRAVAFIPLGAARELVAEHPAGMTANALVITTSDATASLAAAQARGFNATTADGFQAAHLGPVYEAVGLFTTVTVVLLMLVGAAWVASATTTAIAHDAKRIATLLAMGIPHRVLRDAWLLAAVWTATAGTLAGAALVVFASLVVRGFRISAGTTADLDVLLRLTPGPILSAMAVAIALTLVATRLALVRLERLPIVATLKA